jgi:hypothetical protein
MLSLFAFVTEFLYPPTGSDFEFRVVLILPSPSHTFQRLDLLKPSKLLFSSLGEKLATSALAN